ncbi:MAG: hypothetical protein R3A45_09430 [Bdellovibrionota bacterium]
MTKIHKGFLRIFQALVFLFFVHVPLVQVMATSITPDKARVMIEEVAKKGFSRNLSN